MVKITNKYTPGYKSKSAFGLPELYYKPEVIDLFGTKVESTITLEDMMRYYFITDGKTKYGYYSGLVALNNMHGTTQVPCTIEMKSKKVKSVKKYANEANTIRFVINPLNKNLTNENAAYLEILDMLEDSYDYFEENRYDCIEFLVKKLSLKKEEFKKYLDMYKYSDRVRRVIYNVYARK